MKIENKRRRKKEEGSKREKINKFGGEKIEKRGNYKVCKKEICPNSVGISPLKRFVCKYLIIRRRGKEE